ncbi:hypothetical protein LTR08_006670 [Meristemomyces frigidus]|nr:hypothetical protein LTR08_006670 [Meristemomyces frigidus]
MGTASFLAGLLPLALSLSSRQLRLITALGTGVLVGTSLIVIIPEGVETLYSAGGSGHGHAERSLARVVARGGGGGLDGWHGGLQHHLWRRYEMGVPGNPDIETAATGVDDDFAITAEDSPPTTDTPSSADRLAGDDEASEPHPGRPREPHAWVGLSLIAGFILMYLIDTLPRHATTHTQPTRFPVSLTQFSFNNRPPPLAPESPHQTSDQYSDSPAPDHPHHTPQSRPSSTTVGLVIHALADGIALGASTGAKTTRLTLTIFLALMLHKAPAAFGLTSVLLKQNLSKRQARAHLTLFSLAAPAGALLTWAAAHLLSDASSRADESGGTEFATGVLLLFSAGTFLYVAMHTMQDSGATGGHAHDAEQAQGNGYAGVPGLHDMYEPAATAAQPEAVGLVDTLVTVGGMLLPLLTQWGHAH